MSRRSPRRRSEPFGLGDPDPERRLVVAQVRRLPRSPTAASRTCSPRGRSRASARPPKGAVKTASGETDRAQFRPIARAASTMRRRWAPFSTGSGRRATIVRSRRSAIASCTAGPDLVEPMLDRRRDAGEAQAPHSARAAPPAAQYRRDRSGDEGLPVDAAGRLLRHRFPSQPSLRPDTFALPRSYYDEGVRRYGFHGLSYEYITRKLRTIAPQIAREDVIIAHLGNGASMCAVHDGRADRLDHGIHRARRAVDGHALRPARSGRACSISWPKRR